MLCVAVKEPRQSESLIQTVNSGYLGGEVANLYNQI